MNVYLLKKSGISIVAIEQIILELKNRNRLSNDIREKKESVNIKELRS